MLHVRCLKGTAVLIAERSCGSGGRSQKDSLEQGMAEGAGSSKLCRLAGGYSWVILPTLLCVKMFLRFLGLQISGIAIRSF